MRQQLIDLTRSLCRQARGHVLQKAYGLPIQCPAFQAVIQRSTDGRTFGHEIALGDHLISLPVQAIYRKLHRAIVLPLTEN